MLGPEEYENIYDQETGGPSGTEGLLRMSQQEEAPAQSDAYHNWIVRYSQNFFGPLEFLSDWNFQIINDLYAVIYAPTDQFGEMEINSFTYSAIPKCYTYMDVESLNASGVTRLHDHPYLKLRGRGTMVAVIDSGIDYRNPVFRDGNGSRILCMWDQSIPGKLSDQAPYGRVYEKAEIDAALRAEDPLAVVPSIDTNGHGTMLAAAAAGGMVPEEGFSGAAPEAFLVVVKLKQAKSYLREFYLYPEDAEVFQEDDIMLAISFAMRCAQRYRMPLSICIGLGSSQGAHLGLSPLAQIINSAAEFTQNCVSVAAGNEGAARHHFRGVLSRQMPEATAELRVGENSQGFTMEFWGNAPEQYSLFLQSPTGETLAISTALKGTTQDLGFVFVETRVLVNYVPIERRSGNTLVYFRFLHPASGIWRIRVQGRDQKNSEFHMWLPVQGLIPADTYFLESSPYDTITSPGDAEGGMTATAYQASNNSLYLEASRGYNLNGTVKPNFAVPGVDVSVPLLQGGFGKASGTSLAAAQNAGISALMLEWAVIRGNEPFFSGSSVKSYLQRGARREEDRQYPNPDWGYGRVDLYHTFELLT